MRIFIVSLIIIRMLVLISNQDISEEDKDPLDMEINGQTTEVMRLFKLNAAGILPQISQRIINETNTNNHLNKEKHLMKKLKQHALNWNM